MGEPLRMGVRLCPLDGCRNDRDRIYWFISPTETGRKQPTYIGVK